jgi:hypothetical protein
MTDDDLTEKTRAQLQMVYTPHAAERILTECWRVEAWQGVDAFCRQLAEGPFA